MKHSSYSQGRGMVNGKRIDLSALSTYLTPAHFLEEEDEPWDPDTLLESIKQQLDKDRFDAEKKRDEERKKRRKAAAAKAAAQATAAAAVAGTAASSKSRRG